MVNRRHRRTGSSSAEPSRPLTEPGVLHRDIKPGNILLSNLGTPKLGDFGIARLHGAPETRSAVITASVAHAAPEVVSGRRPDARSDIYSLASTLYELIAGGPAFSRPTDESLVPMLARIAQDPVPDLRPSGVPDAICGVLEAAMAKDLDARPATAADLGRALAGAQTTAGVPATAMRIEGEPSIAPSTDTTQLPVQPIAPLTGHPPAPVAPPAAAAPPTPAVAPPPPRAPSPSPAPAPPSSPPGGGSPPTSPGSPGGSRKPRIATPAIAAAAIGVVALVAAVGFAVTRESDPGSSPPVTSTTITTTTAPVPSSTTTTAPSSTGGLPNDTGEDYASYTELTDTAAAITVDVPAEWTDVLVSTGSVTAAPLIADAFESYRGPGVNVSAIANAGGVFTPETTLDLVEELSCGSSERGPYDDGVYVGFYDRYRACGSTGADVIHVSAEPDDRSFIVTASIQFLTPARRDRGAADPADVPGRWDPVVSGDQTVSFRPPPPGSGVGDLTDNLVAADAWTDELVAAAAIPVLDVPIVTVGGGLGSFAFVDILRIAGLDPASVRVLTGLDEPWATYKFLAENSQIPGHERLRSDASSVMDSIWGWPSYAAREAAAETGLKNKLRPLWNVLWEPIGIDYWTPRAGQVYESVRREAARIGWTSMLMKGQVRMTRRRHGGGYFTILTPPEGASTTKRVALRSRFVHVAVGYPGVRFLPDLQRYRETHRDFSRVVNAYEPHDYVYEELRRRPGTVLIRGSGIVASRVLQRLIDDRDAGASQTTILHLFRNYPDRPEGDSVFFRRPARNGWAYQGFNFPKAAWGGQLRDRLAGLDGPGRAALISQMGGTNTPQRRDWIEQLDRGAREGFYRQYIGEVADVRPADGQSITTTIRGQADGTSDLTANFIIDATGLESDISEHRVLADLLDHGGAQRNAYGRLEVNPSFEIVGTRSEPGRMYASGSITLGGYYAGVDSFLGLQYAALAIADDLATTGTVRRIGVGRSVGEWWRWLRNRPPAGAR